MKTAEVIRRYANLVREVADEYTDETTAAKIKEDNPEFGAVSNAEIEELLEHARLRRKQRNNKTVIANLKIYGKLMKIVDSNADVKILDEGEIIGTGWIVSNEFILENNYDEFNSLRLVCRETDKPVIIFKRTDGVLEAFRNIFDELALTELEEA